MQKHRARKHGARATKRGISNEYIAICTDIKRDGSAIAETINQVNPSSDELESVFSGHLAENALNNLHFYIKETYVHY